VRQKIGIVYSRNKTAASFIEGIHHKKLIEAKSAINTN